MSLFAFKSGFIAWSQTAPSMQPHGSFSTGSDPTGTTHPLTHQGSFHLMQGDGCAHKSFVVPSYLPEHAASGTALLHVPKPRVNPMLHRFPLSLHRGLQPADQKGSTAITELGDVRAAVKILRADCRIKFTSNVQEPIFKPRPFSWFPLHIF